MLYTARSRGILFSIYIIIVLPHSVLAAQMDDFFSQGIVASKQNKPEEAIEAFKAAQAAGMDKPLLHYNLGVSYFQTGQYEDAKRAFAQLVDNPKYSPLVNYNLGLIALKNDEISNAEDRFRYSLKTSSDRTLRALSVKALNRLGVQVKSKGFRKKGGGRAWYGLVDVSISDDSNVNLDNADALLGGSTNRDTVLGVIAKAHTYISGERKDGIRFDVVTDILKNQTFSARDFSSIHLSLSKETNVEMWPYHVRGFFQQNRFGGNAYSRMLGFEMGAERKLSAMIKFKLRYRYYKRNAADPVFDYIDGDRHQLRGRIYWGERKHRWRFEYKYQLDNSADLRGNNFFRSYSNERYTIRITKYFPIVGKFSGKVDVEHRDTNYMGNDVLSSGTTYLRHEDRTRASLEFRYMGTRHWDLYFTYRHTDNVSNRLDNTNEVDTFSYERDQILLGSIWRF